tara:strand:- start:346 stop:720 length:375 start_codon:yes stop_codon:yes gene_type:complete
MKIDRLDITDSTYFVRNNRAIIDSLFAGYSTTAAGVFKIMKNRVMFYDMQGELFAALIVNKRGDNPFFVNATVINGKTFYQHSLGEIQAKNLGIDHCGYRSEQDKAACVAHHAGLWESFIKQPA